MLNFVLDKNISETLYKARRGKGGDFQAIIMIIIMG